MNALGTALACLVLCRWHKGSQDKLFREMAVRFHNERYKRLHPMLHPAIDAPPLGNDKFVIPRRGTLTQRPPKRVQRSEYLLHDDAISDDSLVIGVCYEAHLAMQKMLTVLAEIRGDDAEGPNS
jgi:hypothetical protein